MTSPKISTRAKLSAILPSESECIRAAIYKRERAVGTRPKCAGCSEVVLFIFGITGTMLLGTYAQEVEGIRNAVISSFVMFCVVFSALSWCAKRCSARRRDACIRRQCNSLRASLIAQECTTVTYHFSKLGKFQETLDDARIFVGFEDGSRVIFSEAIFEVGICAAEFLENAGLRNDTAPTTMTIRRLISGELLHVRCGSVERVFVLEKLGLVLDSQHFFKLEDGIELVLADNEDTV